MRNLQLSYGSNYGVEIISIVRIYRENGQIVYTDKEYKIETETETTYTRPTLVSLSNLDETINLSKGSKNTDCSVVICDADNQLKLAYDFENLYNKKVTIGQIIGGIEETLFIGYIDSPITWNENDRTFSFNVTNKLSDRELGFTFDMLTEEKMPQFLSGRNVPIFFGNNFNVNLSTSTPAPHFISRKAIGVLNLDVFLQEIAELRQLYFEAKINGGRLADLANQKALEATLYNDGDNLSDNPPNDLDKYKQLLEEAEQYRQQAVQLYHEANIFDRKINYLSKQIEGFNDTDCFKITIHNEKSVSYDEFPIYHFDIDPTHFSNPDFRPALLKINSSYFSAVIKANVKREQDPFYYGCSMKFLEYVGDDDTSDNYIQPIKVDTQSFLDKPNFVIQQQNSRQIEKMKWFSAGSRMSVVNYEMYYAVGLGDIKVTRVTSKFKGGSFVLDPSSYTVKTTQIGGIKFTYIILPSPLSLLKGPDGSQAWDSDDISVDITNDLNKPNEIIEWVVQNFTNLQIDSSINELNFTNPDFKLGFYLENSMNVYDFIKSFCYHFKVATWIENNTIYFKYLHKYHEPVDELLKSDIIDGTLQVFSSDSSELVTKFTGEFNFNNYKAKYYERINLDKYGMFEESFYYYAFNNATQVRWSLLYWSIIKSNIWKKIKFKTGIHKLRWQPFDAIQVRLPEVFQAPVEGYTDCVGLVESTNYDISSGEIEVVIWLPIRLGEMAPYKFLDQSINVTFKYPEFEPEIYTGSPFQNEQGNDFVDAFKNIESGRLAIQYKNTERTVEEYNDVKNYETTTAVIMSSTDSKLIPQIKAKDPITNIDVDPKEALKNANYRDRYKLSEVSEVSEDFGRAYLGIVEAHLGGNKYRVNIPDLGGNVNVLQQQIDTQSVIPVGTSVIVIRGKDSYKMQTPIWLLEPKKE